MRGLTSEVYIWPFRYLSLVLAMVLWLVLVLLWSGYYLPDPKADGGLENWNLATTLGRVTLLYYVAVLPMLLLPMSAEARGVWFYFTGYGWLALLLGAPVVYWSLHWLNVDELLFLAPYRYLLIGLSALFVAAFVGTLLFANDSRSRAGGAIFIVLGIALILGAPIAFWNLRNGWPQRLADDGSSFAAEKIAMLLASLAWVLAITAVAWPSTRRGRLEAGLFNGFLLLFVVAVVLGWQVWNDRITFEPDNQYPLWMTLIVALASAPFLSAVGLPNFRSQRLGWMACVILAAGTTWLLASRSIYADGESMLENRFTNYDGPRLIRPSDRF